MMLCECATRRRPRSRSRTSLATSPTARTLAECRKRGWSAYVCEKWIPGANVRKDAFGFGDVLVMDGEPGSMLIQATVTGSMSSRVTKIKTFCLDDAKRWLKAGNRIEVWGWAKNKRGRWELSQRVFKL